MYHSSSTYIRQQSLVSSHPLRHPYPLAQADIAQFLLVGYTLFQALALIRGLGQPDRERLKLGVRMQSSVREIERFECAFERLERTRLNVPGAPALRKLRFWVVRDGRGMRIR